MSSAMVASGVVAPAVDSYHRLIQLLLLMFFYIHHLNSGMKVFLTGKGKGTYT